MQTAAMPQNGLPIHQQMASVPQFRTFVEQGKASLIKDFGSESRVRLFQNSVIEQLTSNKALQSCSIESIVIEAKKATNIGLSLLKSYSHAYLVPYSNVPQLIIGWRGYVALALNSGKYRVVNAGVVYEGEIERKDKLSGDIIFKTEDYSQSPVAGYFAYFEIENPKTHVVNRHTVYMTVAEMVTHAKAYVKTLKNSTREQLFEAAYKQEQAGIGWLNNFQAMALKTVVKQLLTRWGVITNEMEEAMAYDNDEVSAEDRHNTIISNTGTQPVEDIPFEDATETQQTAPEQSAPDF